MMVPLWVLELASAFWEAAGDPGLFPRDLSRPIADALGLTIKRFPRLSSGLIVGWLRERGVACPFDGPDRALCASLLARSGRGFIFIDADDAEDERRFSLAHELAHFLRHYWEPRRRAIARLGLQVREVLDGERAARPNERLHAILAGVPLGDHVHLMTRDRRDGGCDRGIATAEAEADRLAFELLAPAEDVAATLGGRADRVEAARLLRETFGLPASAAEHYATALLPEAPRDPVLRILRA